MQIAVDFHSAESALASSSLSEDVGLNFKFAVPYRTWSSVRYAVVEVPTDSEYRGLQESTEADMLTSTGEFRVQIDASIDEDIESAISIFLKPCFSVELIISIECVLWQRVRQQKMEQGLSKMKQVYDS